MTYLEKYLKEHPEQWVDTVIKFNCPTDKYAVAI